MSAHVPGRGRRSAPQQGKTASSSKDLCFLALELLSRDDTAVTKVSQLRQLVRGSRRSVRRGLLDVAAAIGLVLALSPLVRPLVEAAAAGDQVDQHADQRDEQHEQEPEGLG